MYRHQDGMSGFSYIFVLTLDDAKYFYLLSSITTLLYCRSLHWAGPLICVQRSGQSGQLSPAPALAPAPSVEGGGGQTGPVRGGALTDTGHCEERSEPGTRGWEHGTSLPSHSGSDCWEDWTLARAGHHPPSPEHLTPEPEMPELIMNHSESARAGGESAGVLGVCHKWWAWCHVNTVGIFWWAMVTRVSAPFTEERIYRIKFCCWNVEE